MSVSWSSTPNLTDFTAFVREVMMIDALLLPDDSVYLPIALNVAVNLTLNVPTCGDVGYVWAVYNLGGHVIVTTAQDQSGRTFFASLREKFGINKFAPGVVQSTSDGGTSTSLSVPDGLSNMTIGDLGRMKTPWGLAYLEYAQDFGSVVGLS